MAGTPGPAVALTDSLVQLVVGHLVSSGSMVSRAYLTDLGAGVVVSGADRSLWLASVLDVLTPQEASLKLRAAEKGGIPVEYGTPRLTKLTLSWGGVAAQGDPAMSVDLVNPNVVVHPGGGSIGVVSLAVPASLGQKISDGVGPRPISLQQMASVDGSALALGDHIGVVTLVGESDGLWPMLRWARVSSDPGFGGAPGAIALDLGLAATQSGSPAFRFAGSGAQFCGLVRPLDHHNSVLVPPAQIAAAIGSA